MPTTSINIARVLLIIGMSIGAMVANATDQIDQIAQTEAVQVTNHVGVPMRDGIVTYADIYVPAGKGPFPVILSRVPYGTQTKYLGQPVVGQFWARKGYVYVAQNVRGRFGSEGLFGAYNERQEERDGYDTVEWITKQPWSNDRVGLMGESYFGYTSIAAANSGHPAIKAISPATISTAREKQVLDGAYPLQSSGMWTLGLDDVVHGKYQDASLTADKYHLPLITLGEVHGMRDVLWRKRITGYLDDPLGKIVEADKDYAKVRVPALHVGGWYDTFTRGSIAIWDGVRRLSSNPGARTQQWLIMGPWDHNSMTDHLINGKANKMNIGKLEIGNAADDTYDKAIVAFFDYTLKGKDNGYDKQPRVQYFNIGDNEWRFSDTWPPKEMRTKALYLHSDGTAATPTGGTLGEQAPAKKEPSDTYDYDPLDPVTITEKTDIWSRASKQPDRGRLVKRADVLTYMTEPLDAPLDITGPIKLELYASSTAVDTDFTAALVDVFPDGYSLLIQEGILRASFRDKTKNPTPIKPGKIYQFNIDLWATSYKVPKGHRLRLEISSSNFPRYARNLNNGETFGMSKETVIATQTIHHTEFYPSKLILPILP